MTDVKGIDFAAIQVRDLEKSAAFYTDVIGLTRAPASPPEAVVFTTRPIPFAVRTPVVDLDATDKLGWGVALWLLADDSEAVYARVTKAGRPIAVEPFDGPFGRTFAFVDPDGYTITIHDKG
ncbi:VOC family protein [Streptomyces sp. LHD-70]|uniref:VOC family protein n=1 Tax=Streptomyces sp. LHD-70 TaxID=3072140 RepID=UPI00280F7A95|nr:VOC family protein [Streptomyces sp. LHD-70]MDQ8705972.1 VOC family protein [Streptomyces sp. LHD-70]